MAEVPDLSNFYSSLHTSMSRREVADFFSAVGWKVGEPDDSDHLDVFCPWAALIMESESPILLHGPVADVEANAEQVLTVLRQAGIVFSAECYGPDDELLRVWQGP